MENDEILINQLFAGSYLNGIKDEGYSQLNKYQEYTEKRIADPDDDTYGKNSHYYIFTPNYNQSSIHSNIACIPN